jgi:hypothetical protein
MPQSAVGANLWSTIGDKVAVDAQSEAPLIDEHDVIHAQIGSLRSLLSSAPTKIPPSPQSPQLYLATRPKL